MKTQPNIHYKASPSGNKVASPQFERLKSNPIRHMRNFTEPTPNRTLNYSNTAPSLEKYNQQGQFTSPSKQNYSNTMPVNFCLFFLLDFKKLRFPWKEVGHIYVSK